MNFRKAKWLGAAILLTGLCISKASAQVADPVLTASKGTSSSNVTVTVTESTQNATVYYTTNGSAPLQTGNSASNPVPTTNMLTINLGTTLKLEAYLGSNTPSDVITAQYTANGFLSTGSQHTVVLKTDGTMWATGANSAGQLGNGTLTTATLPVQASITGANPIGAITSKTILVDTNGLPDWWELKYFNQLGLNASSSPDGNGFTLLQDYQSGANPTNYFSQPSGSGGAITLTPSLLITNGNNQSVTAGTTASQPLAVRVSSGSSGASVILPNAPVQFSVSGGTGLISTTSGGTGSATIPSTTNASGVAQVYFQQPAGTTGTTTVTVTSAGQSISFTETGIPVIAPVITSPNTAAGIVSSPFTYPITATNAPVSYSLIGTLPTGLTLSAGTITGTPTAAGSAIVTLNATNSAGTGSESLTITIAAAGGSLPVTSGLLAWYNASSLVVSSGNVTRWNDLSGNNYYISHALPFYGSGPTSSTDPTTGLTVAAFNGNEQFLDSSVHFTQSAFANSTIFVVSSTTNTSTTGVMAEVGSGTGYDLQGIASSSGNQAFLYGTPGGGASTTSGGAMQSTGNLAVNEVQYSTPSGTTTTTATLYSNGTANGQGSIPVSEDSVSGDICVGATYPYYGDNFTGNIAEIIIYNQALTTSQRLQVEAYLEGKYGISATTLPALTPAYGTVGTAFSYNVPVTNNATTSAVYSAANLPPGLSIDSSGVVSGSPTVAGTYSATIRATSSGSTATALLSVTIYAQSSPVLTNDIASGTLGQPFSYYIKGSNLAATYGATGLPGGLMVSSTTGQIYGTPTASGTSNVTITAQNQWGTGTANLTLTIYPILPVTSGLTAWFNATSGVTQNNGIVSQWNDLSGNGYNITPNAQSGLTAPTQTTDPVSGNPQITFNGSQGLYDPALVNASSDLTIITVAASRNTGTADQVLLGAAGITGGGDRDYSYTAATDQNFNTYGSGGNGGAIPATSNLAVTSVTFSYSGQLASFYSQGAANGTVGVSGGTLLSGLTIGHAWIGDIAEVAIYNRVLSQTERQEIELALSIKYGVQYVPPVITPNGGAYSSVTISTISPAVVHYTLNGTAPTSGSPTYTGPLTLTQSCPVTCAYFYNNIQISPTATAQFYVGDYINNGVDTGISSAWVSEYNLTNILPNQLVEGGSGLTYLQAYLWGYNPTVFSSNGDGLSDATNYLLGYAATNTDINGYTNSSGVSLTNAQQLALGLDPFDMGVNPPPGTPPSDPGDTVPPTITLTAPSGATQISP